MRHERFPEDGNAHLASSEARAVWNALLPRRGRALLRLAIAGGAALAELVAVALTGLACEMVYHLVSYERQPELGPSLAVGLFLGLFVVLPNIARGEYSIENYLARAPHFRRIVSLWLAAWAVVLVLGFLSKTTGDHSRVATLTTFLAGLPVLVATRLATVALVRRLITPRSDSARRIHLIGYEEDVASFYATHDTAALGLRVIGVSTLRDAPEGGDQEARRTQLSEDLDLSVSVVRFLRPDDVFVLVPWAEVEDLEACVDAFLRVPVALHLRPGRVMDRFSDVRLGRVGLLTGINVGRAPLTTFEIAAKRTFDLLVASLALVALSPLLLLIAALIRLDSRGPSLFRQKRYGFNQEAFWVFKFRSMRSDAGAAFRQATRDDDRITRIGRFLRRTNLDELPQLLNVIRGDMSLVGPRPHALAHDRSFERRIALYARRHNVKPGITGWAQVNGFRGETLTDAAMEQRVQADLHYIDNWSLWLDITILFRTIASPRAYRNAF